jgi:transcription elongation factor Elf1
MNPHWIQTIYQKLKSAARKCPHCGREAVYPTKQTGQYHTCKFCQHRFQEKGK